MTVCSTVDCDQDARRPQSKNPICERCRSKARYGKGTSVCAAGSCSKPVKARGLCVQHYQSWRTSREDGNRCSAEDCTRAAWAQGFCGKHYGRFLRHGDVTVNLCPGRGEPVYSGAGGYLYRLAHDHPNANLNGQIAEHRLIMSEALGRALLPGESVHHKNGNRIDNRLENLELWSSVQPAGQRVEDKITWAKEILATYAPEVLA